MNWQRRLAIKAATIKGAHMCRVNIAAGRHRTGQITLREFRDEVARAERERDNATGEMILQVIKTS